MGPNPVLSALNAGTVDPGQATNTGVMGLSTTDQVAAAGAARIVGAANQDVLAQYQGLNLTQNCMNGQGRVLTSVPLDVRFIQAAENPYIQADVVNSGATDETVVIGSVLAAAGAAPFFKTAASAADAATVADQNGANVRFLQGFGLLTCYTPVVINLLKLISTDSTQRNQPFKYQDLAYDNTVNGITNNTTSTFTRFDTDPNVVALGGAWILGPQNYITIVSKAGKDMTLIFGLAGIASVRSFKGANG